MINRPTLDKDVERSIQLQIAEYEETNLKQRVPEAASSETPDFLGRIILAFEVLQEAGIEADGNNSGEKLEAAIKKLTSTPEGIAWIKERVGRFGE